MRFKEVETLYHLLRFQKDLNLKQSTIVHLHNAKKLSSVDLSNCNFLTNIGIKAFYECSTLSNVILPTNLDIISRNCFGYCDLRTINIPNNIKEMKNRCFNFNNNLKTVTITDNSMLTRIKEYSMQGSIIETIFLPKNVNYFAANSFENSRTLKTITCNPSNPSFSVMDGVLYNKEKTMLVKYPANHGTSFEIPEKVTRIGFCAFIYSVIESITFPSNLKTIEGWAFAFTNLKTLKIPDTVTEIYNGVFAGCVYLGEITLGAGMTYIPNNCFSNAKITKIIIPENITSIGDYAFSDCPNLKEVVLPSTITNLGGSCFPTNVNISFPSDAKLSLDDQQILYDLDKIVLIMCLKKSSSYIIPETVSTIRAPAFKDMTDLTKIEFRSGTTLKTIESSAFCTLKETIITNNCTC
ncbi:surface antigen BspA-like [Trichomonas vaginalis G3]|uniref:Surface antigen BspA-like n=1 Tax=Trichomonas vaginalis (strain ATCC PRA-98 / G3) TaxID=412133 RepID=A2ESA5_TRIV3|nr:regulation of response to stimulus [Trichomonas vaginalis G3]EAY04469.1 surface antigen BspA-like [Trichomonas vaginalis G3]KAI5510256.1 regulation of response to stimulus [Trichomonas vaginalis G3]|eukprot:XP_001316692.1 surface antigen BspA-like [Trichomonas vaginalis G3]